MAPRESGSMAYLLCICIIAALGGMLLGYDTAVISGAEQALQDYFIRGLQDDYTEALHNSIMYSALIGCIIGSLSAGHLADVSGRRNAMISASILLLISAAGSYMPEFMFKPGLKMFAPSEATKGMVFALIAYRAAGGIGIGIISVVCPVYIAETAPAHIRGALVSFNQLAIIAGQLSVCIVIYILRSEMADTPDLIQDAMEGAGWRKMFLSEIYPAAGFAILLFLLPETPIHLTMNGSSDKAYSVLIRINGPNKAGKIIRDIKKSISKRGDILSSYGKRVIITGIILIFFQQATGIGIITYYTPKIFTSIGTSIDASMICTTIMCITSILFVAIAIIASDKIGRRKLLIIGSAGMAVGMIALGTLSYYGTFGITTILFIIIYTAIYMMSWGPMCMVLVSEIFPNTIRIKAVSIVMALQWAASCAVCLSFPKLHSWSICGTCLIIAVITILSGIFAYRFIPETKNKTLEEIGALWKATASK